MQTQKFRVMCQFISILHGSCRIENRDTIMICHIGKA